MSSYTCENFQLFILYNFHFDDMILKLILYVSLPQIRIFPYDRDFSGSVAAGMKVENPYFTNQKFFASIYKFFTPYLALKIHVTKKKYGILYKFQAQEEGVKTSMWGKKLLICKLYGYSAFICTKN